MLRLTHFSHPAESHQLKTLHPALYHVRGHSQPPGIKTRRTPGGEGVITQPATQNPVLSSSLQSRQFQANTHPLDAGLAAAPCLSACSVHHHPFGVRLGLFGPLEFFLLLSLGQITMKHSFCLEKFVFAFPSFFLLHFYLFISKFPNSKSPRTH